MIHKVEQALADAAQALDALRRNTQAIACIDAAASILAASLAAGGRVFSCGNGGSLCDAMHFAEELSGNFRIKRTPLAATSITDAGHMSCTANDFGFEAVFSRYLEAHGRSKDVLLAISTSGSSANIIKACTVARERQMHIISLTGRAESQVGRLADVDICTVSGFTYADRVQELHIKVIHILIELCERKLFPELYREA